MEVVLEPLLQVQEDVAMYNKIWLYEQIGLLQQLHEYVESLVIKLDVMSPAIQRNVVHEQYKSSFMMVAHGCGDAYEVIEQKLVYVQQANYLLNNLRCLIHNQG